MAQPYKWVATGEPSKRFLNAFPLPYNHIHHPPCLSSIGSRGNNHDPDPPPLPLHLPSAQCPLAPAKHRPRLAYLPRAIAQATAQTGRPSSPLHPEPPLPSPTLTIGRVQSTYQAGGTAVITYTIRNNQSAHALPQLQAGLNVTDTVAALAGFDPLADPNTLHNLIVRHDFSNATLLDASVWPTSAGNVHLFQVGSLAPRAETTFTLTVQLPATAATFTTLGQATVYGTLHGREITATAHPIRLAPSGFAQWLTPTPDVTLQDTAMLMQSAELGDDPLAFFDYVQQFGYHAYQGSLRGTRGTLWSEAGNSVDQSSLLIAFLRSAGYPARYRHGTLPTAEARALLASMFPASPTCAAQSPLAPKRATPSTTPPCSPLPKNIGGSRRTCPTRAGPRSTQPWARTAPPPPPPAARPRPNSPPNCATCSTSPSRWKNTTPSPSAA